MVKSCPECGKENVDANKFCEYCGSNLPIVEEEKSIDLSSVIDNPRETIKQNIDTIKDKVESTVTEEKLRKKKKKIKKQKKQIEKNQELIDRQNKNISKNKTVNDSELHKLKYKLFYWNNKELNEYVFSKTKSISILIFIIFFVWAALMAPVRGIFSVLIGSLLVGLFFAVPAFVIGYVIHYLMNRK